MSLERFKMPHLLEKIEAKKPKVEELEKPSHRATKVERKKPAKKKK